MQLSPKLEKALQELFPSTDPLDQPNFDPVAYINMQFPNEHSLNNIEEIKNSLYQEYQSVQQEIRDLVREQAELGDNAKQLLLSSKNKVQELSSCILLMRDKALASEQMVEEICQDIKSLDTAKKNLTLTITALKKLGMLSHGVQQLANACADKDYRMAGALLDATAELIDFFKDCDDVSNVTQLKRQRDGIAQELKLQLLEDFRDLENAQPENIWEACQAVDELGIDFRNQVSNQVCAYFLGSYNQLFNMNQMHSGFDHIDRRYAWLRRCIRDLSTNYSGYFPAEWQLQAILTREFCEFTKQHIMALLDQGTSDTSLVVSALQKTIQFENDMTKRFASHNVLSEQGEGIELDNVLGGYEKASYKSAQKKVTSIPKFKGVISICFEPYLVRYCEVEEQNLKESIEKFVLDDPQTEGSVLNSSINLFGQLKQKFNKTLSFSRGQTLLEMGWVFKHSLRYYADKLLAILPRIDRPFKLDAKDERMIALIVNSADYCRSTISEMEATVNTNLESHLEIEFSDEQNLFLEQPIFSLTGRAIQSLIVSVEQKLDPFFKNMTKSNWVLEGVGDKSEYVVGLAEILNSVHERLHGSLAEEYYLTFLNKLAESFNANFVSSVYKCKRISEYGAQQLLLDCYEMKTRFLALQPRNAGSYPSIVNKLFHRTENLLKVLSSAPERLQENYRTFIDNPSQADFEKIVGLMGLKRNEQLWETFNPKKLLKKLQQDTQYQRKEKFSKYVGNLRRLRRHRNG